MIQITTVGFNITCVYPMICGTHNHSNFLYWIDFAGTAKWLPQVIKKFYLLNNYHLIVISNTLLLSLKTN